MTGPAELAFWLFGDFVIGGVAPYLDLPATAWILWADRRRLWRGRLQ
jgi:hypothetical protein